MADLQQPVDQQVTPASMADTQQVTSKTPATKQKNPKRVAAGKAIAERTRIARESQKKVLIEAQSIIANNQAKRLILQTTLHRLHPRPPNTFSQQHNGLASSALSFHWWGSTTNAKR